MHLHQVFSRRRHIRGGLVSLTLAVAWGMPCRAFAYSPRAKLVSRFDRHDSLCSSGRKAVYSSNLYGIGRVPKGRRAEVLHSALDNDGQAMEPLFSSTNNMMTDDAESEKAYLAVQEEISNEEIYEKAIAQTVVWVAAAWAFGLALFQLVSHRTGEEFIAGYLVEQSLSVDNLFVFLLLFDYFKVPIEYQNRVLNWGIFGAVVMRGVMIGLGAVALERFHAILLFFAGFLVYSSVQTLAGLFTKKVSEDDEENVGDDIVVKFTRNLFPSTDRFDGDRFFTLDPIDGLKKATPLFLCMCAVEISDVVFAVDSIPAVFGVTQDPLVVFTSNLFAIMGLRSLYTVLSKAAADLEYLEPAVAVVLGFIGSKMVVEYFGHHISTMVSLFVVTAVLSTGIVASLLVKEKEE